MAAETFTYGFGLTTLARHDGEDPRRGPRRIRSRRQAQQRAGSSLGTDGLIEPLRPGEHEPTITREQIELEDEMLRAWEDYLTKRNAYLAATSTPEPA
jgi:hypothetical protein